MAEFGWVRELLQGAGLRITGPRVTVLRALADRPHAAADAIADAVRNELGAVSTQAIYDVLRACSEAGIVRRIQPVGSPARYELRVRDKHHHLMCRTCGTVGDVDEAEVVFWGTCPECRPTKEHA